LNTATEKTPTTPVWVAGFMSGTSLDAVDAAVILTDGEKVTDFGPAVERRYSAEERKTLQAATDAARTWNWTGPIPEAPFKAALDVITRTHTEAWHMLTGPQRAPVPLLAGIHGQTVLHRRAKPGEKGATLQLVHPFALRAALGVPLVCDFRSADVEAGGQGAPLAPAYHGALLDRLGKEPACVLNLGGVANITARLSDGRLVAFDTGPANGPIDEWVEGHGRGTHDAGGKLALAGTVHTGLLAQLMNHDWFSEKPPKSLDRYDFNASVARGLSVEDGAATLTAFSAAAVAAGVDQLPERPTRVIACGGGRHNPALMAALRGALKCPLMSAEDAGWRGDSIEAEAFAYLAARRMRELPLSWPMTTGVPQPITGGQVFI
jgi:anhydro-N-acetylmuramic acid kinase